MFSLLQSLENTFIYFYIRLDMKSDSLEKHSPVGSPFLTLIVKYGAAEEDKAHWWNRARQAKKEEKKEKNSI